MQNTPISLLERLQRSGEKEAWDRFVTLYTPLLYHWARRLGLQESDAADLVQEVFAILIRELPAFRYHKGKRFRGWLWTTLVNKWREGRRRKNSRLPEAAGVDPDGLAGPDATTAVEDAEYRQYLVAEALRLMQVDFQPITWRACWEYAVAGRPAAEVAAELGITVNAVHLAKSRVLRRLRQELKGLLD
jgi:RNA polymerase sigma-70 factor (ECF subfamily)